MIRMIDRHHLSRWKNASIAHFACKKTLRVKTYRKLYASRTWGVPEVPRISPTDLPPLESPPPPHREVKRPSSDFASTRRRGTETVTLPKFVPSLVPRAETQNPSLGILTMMMPSYTLSLYWLTKKNRERIQRTTITTTNKNCRFLLSALFFERERQSATMRESCITLKTFSQRTREKRKERKKKKREEEKKMFRVFNTLNVWVLSRFSLGRHSSLVRSYICAVNTTDKTLRLAFSHVLSLSAKYLCETTRDICLFVVVVRVFSCCCCCCVLLEERELFFFF